MKTKLLSLILLPALASGVAPAEWDPSPTELSAVGVASMGTGALATSASPRSILDAVSTGNDRSLERASMGPGLISQGVVSLVTGTAAGIGELTVGSIATFGVMAEDVMSVPRSTPRANVTYNCGGAQKTQSIPLVIREEYVHVDDAVQTEAGQAGADDCDCPAPATDAKKETK